MQSFLAGIALFVILFVGENISPGAIIAGIAGTTALIFFAPSSYAAHPRRVIGGHMLAIIVAIISSLIFEIFFDPTASVSNFWVYFYSSISLGFLIFFMAIFNCEHAPSAGCLLGLTIGGVNLDYIAFIFLSALILSVIRLILLRWIRNLV